MRFSLFCSGLPACKCKELGDSAAPTSCFRYHPTVQEAMGIEAIPERVVATS